jgi:hypothetical protein
MKRLFAFLISGYWNEPKRHEHEWETIEVHTVYTDGNELPIGRKYILRCKVCGDIKTVKCY